MNTHKLLLPGFAIVIAVQLAVPAWMIIERELTLREGQVFKFKTRPIDPADAFRGRYVWLGLEPDRVKVPDADQWHYDTPAFAVLGTNTAGFAIVQRLEHVRPAQVAAVPVRVRYPDMRQGEVTILWPGLDRYYMTEEKAPAAEAAYRGHSVRTNQTCHVTVRVRNGCAAIEELFIEGQPIGDWLKQHPAGQ